MNKLGRWYDWMKREGWPFIPITIWIIIWSATLAPFAWLTFFHIYRIYAKWLGEQ